MRGVKSQLNTNNLGQEARFLGVFFPRGKRDSLSQKQIPMKFGELRDDRGGGEC